MKRHIFCFFILVLLVSSVVSASSVTRYVDNVAQITDGEVSFKFNDRIGSQRIIVNEGGEVIAVSKELPYGQVVVNNGSKYSFTGKEKDVASGLHYFSARYYDSDKGRFVSADPVGDGVNHYVYVSNNPMNYIDSTGMNEVDLMEMRIAEFDLSLNDKLNDDPAISFQDVSETIVDPILYEVVNAPFVDEVLTDFDIINPSGDTKGDIIKLVNENIEKSINGLFLDIKNKAGSSNSEFNNLASPVVNIISGTFLDDTNFEYSDEVAHFLSVKSDGKNFVNFVNNDPLKFDVGLDFLVPDSTYNSKAYSHKIMFGAEVTLDEYHHFPLSTGNSQVENFWVSFNKKKFTAKLAANDNNDVAFSFGLLLP